MDREAQFKTVLESNQDRIYRICCCYIRDEDERRDVFQDFLLQIWKSLDTFANRSAISTWIYRFRAGGPIGRPMTRLVPFFEIGSSRQTSVGRIEGHAECSEEAVLCLPSVVYAGSANRKAAACL